MQRRNSFSLTLTAAAASLLCAAAHAQQVAQPDAGPNEAQTTPRAANAAERIVSKEVVSGEALTRASQEGYGEAIRNQAGVVPLQSSGSALDGYSIRGIRLNFANSFRMDGGMPYGVVASVPTENKERIETLKGANALLYGIASPAGIINLIPKRAGARDVTTVGLGANAFGQYGANVDIGRRFGDAKQFGVRVNASATHFENGIHDLGGSGYFVAFATDWRVSDRLNVELAGERIHRDVAEQVGIRLLPAVNGVVPITRVPDPQKNLWGPGGNWDVYHPRADNLQARVDYKFSDDWRALVQVGRNEAERERGVGQVAQYNAVTGANGVLTFNHTRNSNHLNFGRSDLIGTFDTWRFRHDLTVGASYTTRYLRAYDIYNLTLATRQNIFDPIKIPVAQLTGAPRENPLQTSRERAVYASDTIGLLPQLKLVVGVRRTYDDETNGTVTTKSSVNSPAVGVLYEVRPTTTVYASYMTGLEGGPVAPVGTVNAAVQLDPTISRQKEVGIRDSSIKGLALNASYFEISRANAVTNPTTNVYGYSGEALYKGVEFTGNYAFLPAWNLSGSLLWLKAKQISPLEPLINGRVPENSPRLNGNVTLAYRVSALPGLTLRATARGISRRAVNNQEQGYIPGYGLYELGAGYVGNIAGKRVSFQASVDNVANRRYWNSIANGVYGVGMVRAVRFNAKIDF
ncbi:TonB-dependent receptor [Ramlibacter albus]|uniref:TonB-dependent siderophore receptor n=1 Tax=Ramlibacter albus TaxID=2079448 RepID=A0A923S3N4_9BURK|nr:TonB-dependent siderophore receptor [Ramlibacter albus]MBC5766744.1 TonB-dependent siderophore receptor [Ramlibacter albus]